MDKHIEEYHHLCEKIQDLLENSRVIVHEKSDQNSQIDFSFPKFDSQTFNCGSYVCVSTWPIFSNESDVCYDEETWQGALSATSTGRELMQAGPNVDELFDTDPKAARTALMEASAELFYNLSLCEYLRGYYKEVATGNQIPWTKIIDHYEPRGFKKNHACLLSMKGQYFIINPSSSAIDLFIAERMNEDTSFCYPPVEWMKAFSYLLQLRLAKLAQILSLMEAWMLRHASDSSEHVTVMGGVLKRFKQEHSDVSHLWDKIPIASDYIRNVKVPPRPRKQREPKKSRVKRSSSNSKVSDLVLNLSLPMEVPARRSSHSPKPQSTSSSSGFFGKFSSGKKKKKNKHKRTASALFAGNPKELHKLKKGLKKNKTKAKTPQASNHLEVGSYSSQQNKKAYGRIKKKDMGRMLRASGQSASNFGFGMRPTKSKKNLMLLAAQMEEKLESKDEGSGNSTKAKMEFWEDILKDSKKKKKKNRRKRKGSHRSNSKGDKQKKVPQHS